MSFIPYKSLVSTYLFKNDAGKSFKYEVYQAHVDQSFYSVIYRLNKISEGNSTWEVVIPEAFLNLPENRMEFTREGVLEHYESNFMIEK